jgi:hypothetical protein
VGRGFAGTLLGDLVLAPPGASAAVDEVRALLGAGILKAASVGLLVHKTTRNEYGGEDILESTLLETSVVSVPANAEALVAAAFGGRREREPRYEVTLGEIAAAVGARRDHGGERFSVTVADLAASIKRALAPAPGAIKIAVERALL